MRVCYNWQFSICVFNKKGKRYKAYRQAALGTKYEDAKCDMESRLRRKQWVLQYINSAKALQEA